MTGKPCKEKEGKYHFLPMRMRRGVFPGCFACDEKEWNYTNLTGRVNNREELMLIHSLFFPREVHRIESGGEYLRIQIGACSRHVAHLRKLEDLIELSGNIITKGIIIRAKMHNI